MATGFAEQYAAEFDEHDHPRDDGGKFTLKVSKVHGPKGEKFENLGGKQQSLFTTEGLPGQMNLFADKGVPDDLLPKHLREPKRYEKDTDGQWVNLGGANAFVGPDGIITKGCEGLRGYHIDDLDDTQDERAAKQDQAEDAGWTSAKSDRAKETWEAFKQSDPTHQHFIGLVRHGGKFHAFEESAQKLHDHLGIGDGQTAEFDEDTLPHHMERLIEGGHRVAVIDRTEDGRPDLDSEADPAAQQAVEEAHEDLASAPPQQGFGIEEVHPERLKLTQDGQEIGYMNLRVMGDRGFIDDTSIHAAARGQGVMQKLWPQIEQHFRNQGATSIRADVVDPAVGQKVWGPLGFVKEGMSGPVEVYRKQLGQAEEPAAPQDSQRPSSRGTLPPTEDPAHHAVAKRFGIPAETVKDLLETHPDELAKRDAYLPPSSSRDDVVGPTLDYEPHPLGTAKIDSSAHKTGDLDRAYVDFLTEFDPKQLKLSEHEDGMSKSASVAAYVDWLKAGHQPPPIGVFDSANGNGDLVSTNRRRVLAAQMAGVDKIVGWHGRNNPETGLPLKFGDIKRAYQEATQFQQPASQDESQPAAPDVSPEDTSAADAWNAATKGPSSASDEQLQQAIDFATHLHGQHRQNKQLTPEQLTSLHDMIDGHVASLQQELERRRSGDQSGAIAGNDGGATADTERSGDPSEPSGSIGNPAGSQQPPDRGAGKSELDSPASQLSLPDRHSAAGEHIQKAKGPLKSLLESLHRLRDTRKTGKVETKELGHEYAREMYDHLKSLRAQGGDEFGEVHDLSEELGHGALGYASPAGNIAMVPPKFKGEDWQARYTLPDPSQQAAEPVTPQESATAASDTAATGTPISQSPPVADPQQSDEPVAEEPSEDWVAPWEDGPVVNPKPKKGVNPKTKLGRAVIEAVGDDPEAQNHFAEIVKQIHSDSDAAARDRNGALRELLANFGFEGRDIGQFVRAARRYSDADAFMRKSPIGRKFDQMVEMAQNYYPQLLYQGTGESIISDPEYALFERLQNGLERPPQPYDEQVISQALEYFAAQERSAQEHLDRMENDPEYRQSFEDMKAVAASQPATTPAPSAPTTFDPEQHGGYQPLLSLADDVRSGKFSSDEFKQQYAFWRQHGDEFQADLQKRFNAQKLKAIASNLGDFNASRNSKGENAKSVYERLLLHAFHTGGTFSYGMEGRLAALDRYVASQTDDKLAQTKAAAEEKAKQNQAAIENPQTLSDFHDAIRHHGGYDKLPEHLQAAYDDLYATKRREGDKSRQATVSGFRPGAEATGEIGIVPGHHQKRNAPTWTVTVEKHLGDDWGDALSRAKQLGGSYVNTRIARAYNATPGFQFFDQAQAEKFAQTLRGQSVDRSDVMDERRAGQIDNASERMAALAKLQRERAQERLNAPRQTNTTRRAEMASNAEAAARSEIAKANTMERLSEGLQNGTIKHLAGIRARTHVDALDSALRGARYRQYQQQSKGGQHVNYEDFMSTPASVADVVKAEYPYPTIWASELNQHINEFADTPGLKKLAASLKKSADRSPFSKKIGAFATDGGVAKTAEDLNESIPGAKFYLKDKAVRIHASRDPKLLQGRHAIAYTADKGKTWGISPEIAAAAAFNKNAEGLDLIDPPKDELLKISDEQTIGQLETAAQKLKRSSDPRLRRIAESLHGRVEDYKRMQSMDIRNVQELRAALREYLPLRAKQEAEDPVKAKERAMVGREFPGFFPTPRPLIHNMLDAADIQPGMSVLEPSAGKGDILDAVKERHPDAQAKGIEYQPALRDVIQTKGHELADENDFLSHTGQYDRIVMNPPFENRQDVQHVQHAYQQLKPGGRLVAVMSSGPFHGSQKRDEEFRNWLNSVGAEIVDNPEGSFAGSDAFRKTGVNTKMVVIDR